MLASRRQVSAPPHVNILGGGDVCRLNPGYVVRCVMPPHVSGQLGLGLSLLTKRYALVPLSKSHLSRPSSLSMQCLK